MLEVLTICLPVFAMIGFGALLRQAGLVNDASHAFLSRFVYLFALPVIIFLAVARAEFGRLFTPSVIVTSLLVILAVAAVSWALTPHLPRGLRAPAVISSFFANTAYLGFPLIRNAYGDAGLGYAAIVNAFLFPSMVILATLLLAGRKPSEGRRGHGVRGAVVNPIVAAAVAGVLFSGAVHRLGLGRHVASSAVLSSAVDIVVRTLAMFEDMALPLALIAVGAGLHFGHVRGRLLLMAACSAGKLIVTPLLTLLACRLFFPGMPATALGTTVLLMGCPLAVTSYVIGREMDADSDFVAGLLVVTTAAACLTIPVWLHILL